MKKIGLVGGTGPESTLMYYKELNTRIDRMTDGRAMPDVAIESVNFRRAWEYVERGQYDLLADYLAEKVNSLTAGGAEIVSLTAGTMHIVLMKNGYHKIGLLGTIFTMEQDYMKADFREAGIEVVIPDKADRELVARRILEELENGIVKETTLKEFQEIIRKMKDLDGIEAVVLGCTELPMILNRDNCPVPCLDSVDIHINELIERAAAD